MKTIEILKLGVVKGFAIVVLIGGFTSVLCTSCIKDDLSNCPPKLDDLEYVEDVEEIN